jgi:hypothetical protein
VVVLARGSPLRSLCAALEALEVLLVTTEYLRVLVEGYDTGAWTAEQVIERLRETIAPERLGGARPWSELQSSGLLWYLNRTTLWPRGYALAFMVDQDNGTVFGWDIVGDGTDPIRSLLPETDRLAKVESLLKEPR